MIDAIRRTNAEILHPALHGHIDMPREWPNSSIMLATEKYRMTIGIEMCSLDTEVPEAREHLASILSGLTLYHTRFQFLTSFQLYLLQGNFSDDSIPVGLCILRIGMAGAIHLLRHTTRIIHHNIQLMLAGFQFRQDVSLRSGDKVAGIHKVSIHIHPSRLRTLQEKLHRRLLPLLRNLDGARISRLALVGIEASKMRGLGGITRCKSQVIGVDGTREHGMLHFLGIAKCHVPFSCKR